MNDVNAILDRVDHFYRGAFGDLMLLTLGIVALVGGLVPIIVALIQNRSLRTSSAALHRQLTERIKELETTLSNKVSEIVRERLATEMKGLEQKFKELDAKLAKEIAVTKTGVFHLQGHGLLGQRNFAGAADSFARACSLSIAGTDERDLVRQLGILCDKILPFLSQNDFGPACSYPLDNRFEGMLRDLEKFNTNDRYSDYIVRVRSGLALAKARTQIVPPTQRPPTSPPGHASS